MSKPKKSKNKLAENCKSYALPTPTPSSTSDYAPSSRSTYPQRSKFASAYFEKLNDPRWQKKRLKIMERDDFTCQKCGDTKTKLAVHHEYYITGRDPWMYPDSALTTLCDPCHDLERKFKDQYSPNSPRDWEAILEAIVPCVEYLDFCMEFTALVKRSGKTPKQVLTWVMHELNGACRGQNA